MPEETRWTAAAAYIGKMPAALPRLTAEVGSIQRLLVQGSNLGMFLALPLTAALVTRRCNRGSILGAQLVASAIGLAAGYAILRYERAGTAGETAGAPPMIGLSPRTPHRR